MLIRLGKCYSINLMKTLDKQGDNKAGLEIRKKHSPYKYTEQFVANELKGMVAELQENKELATKAQLFQGRSYSKVRFYEWKLKYNTKRLNELNQKIDEILEARLIERGFDSKNFAFVIFLLKNHHGYLDRKETEVEHTHVFKVTRGLQQGRKRIKATVKPSVVKNIQGS